jgi:uncharacterized membrane protein YbhN (UPF0104 family)
MRVKSSTTEPVIASILLWNWFAVFKVMVQIVLGAGLLWLIFDWFSLDGTRFIGAFGQASFLLLSLAVICFALSIVFKSLQCLVLFPPSVSSGYIAGLILSQNALLTVLPWRIGEISFPVLLRQDQNIPIASSVSSLIAIRCLDLLVVMIVAMIGSRKLGFQISLTNVALAIGIAITLVGAGEFALRRFRGKTMLKAAVVAIKSLSNPVQFGSLLLLSIGIFSLSTLQSTFVLRGLGLPVSLSDIALLNAFTLLAALLPIHPPGGWGTMDSIQIAILHYLSYQPEQSAPVILAAHCFYTLLVFSGGVFGWILRGRNLHQ